MASFVHGGQGFNINAGDITNVGRDQISHYHSHHSPSSPLTVRIVTPDGHQSLANPWTYDPLPVPSPTDPTIHSSTRYALLLLSKREGYPLWYPQPKPKLPPEYRNSGVRIGDVGIVRSNTPFDYLFNICHPANHPINRFGVPKGFVPLPDDQIELSHSSEEIYRHPGTPVVVPGSIKLVVDHDGAHTYKFTSTDAQGAILMLPDGSWREEVANIGLFQRYAQRHSESWFPYAEQDRDRCLAPGTILYLVTGYERCSSWGVSTFLNPARNAEPLSLPLKVTHDGNGASKRYTWEFTGSNSCEARCYPGALHSIPNGQTPCNSCVFMQGYVISRKPTRHDHPKVRDIDEVYIKAKRKNDYSIFGQTGSNNDNSSGGRSQFLSDTPRSQNGHGYDGMHQYPIGSAGSEDITIRFHGANPATFHPANDIINPFMLAITERIGDSSIAISHDKDWVALLSDVPSEKELIRRLVENYRFVVKDGVTCLESLNDESVYHVKSKMESGGDQQVIVAQVDMVFEHSDSDRSSEGSTSDDRADIEDYTFGEEHPTTIPHKSTLTIVDFGTRPASYNPHFNIMAYTLSTSSNPSNREMIKTAISMLCSFYRDAWGNFHGENEIKTRLELFFELQEFWSTEDGSDNSDTPTEANPRLSFFPEEKEKRIFGDVLRDGYVLCRLMNHLQDKDLLYPDPYENGVDSVKNLESFRVACITHGISDEDIFQISDLVAGTSKSLARVAKTIIALFNLASEGNGLHKEINSESTDTTSSIGNSRISVHDLGSWGSLTSRSSRRRSKRRSRRSDSSYSDRARLPGKRPVLPPPPRLPPPLPPTLVESELEVS
ncbi:Protein kinase of the Mitotic Exit Network [Paramarasmius palmivorus]|uniref:Protein kinase of the Mitotic Exit Network n=1 Tax=Paramarasmius palmivorus TaxID=297713 RepID=A0AAW0CUE8_9AGAR